jgi:hypothetical protein
MDRVGARGPCGVEDSRDREIGLGGVAAAERDGSIRPADVDGGGVRLREDRDAADPELARSSEDADRDLASVGDEKPADRPRRYFLPRWPFSQSDQSP